MIIIKIIIIIILIHINLSILSIILFLLFDIINFQYFFLIHLFMKILILVNLFTFFASSQIIKSAHNLIRSNISQQNIEPIDPLIASLFSPQYLPIAEKLNLAQNQNKQDDNEYEDVNWNQDQKIRFRQFQTKFQKKYSKDQILFRFKVFLQNEKEINRQNAQKRNYQLGINKFGDLTPKQFQNTYLMKPTQIDFPPVMTAPPPSKQFYSNTLIQNLHSGLSSRRLQQKTIKSIDYRKLIKLGPIKDQGSCGACYAFANIGVIQLNWAYKYNQTQPNLSEQQIIDCCKQSGFICDGCITGNMGSSIDYLQKVGISLTQHYPYRKTPSKCRVGFKTKNYLTLNGDSYQQTRGVEGMTFYLLNKGPVSVAIFSQVWKFYQKGVFNGCPSKNVTFDHAVVVIGIQQNGTWIIRNSWGSDWGQRGYLRLAAGNTCGLTDYVFYPLII